MLSNTQSTNGTWYYSPSTEILLAEWGKQVSLTPQATWSSSDCWRASEQLWLTHIPCGGREVVGPAHAPFTHAGLLQQGACSQAASPLKLFLSSSSLLCLKSSAGVCAFGSVLVNEEINQSGVNSSLYEGSRLCLRYISLTLHRGSHWPQQEMFLSQQKVYLELAFTIGIWGNGFALKFAVGWAKPEEDKITCPVCC